MFEISTIEIYSACSDGEADGDDILAPGMNALDGDDVYDGGGEDGESDWAEKMTEDEVTTPRAEPPQDSNPPHSTPKGLSMAFDRTSRRR